MKKLSLIGFWFILIIGLVYYFVSAENFTLTTYYPAPYGVYKEIRTNQLAIGSSYRNVALGDGDFVVNGSTGIGTDAPTQKLDVNGQVRIREGSPGADKILVSDATGVGSWEAVGAAAKSTFNRMYSRSTGRCVGCANNIVYCNAGDIRVFCAYGSNTNDGEGNGSWAPALRQSGNSYGCQGDTSESVDATEMVAYCIPGN
ncbi:MAG: hypothetical protein ABIE75_01045 [Candidatus Omnitrophota bacterium]